MQSFLIAAQFPCSVIELKVGALILLTVNVNPAMSLMNGSKLCV